LWREGALDQAEVRVEARRPGLDTDELAGRIKAALRQELGVSMSVQFGGIPTPEGSNKALRVIDERSGVC
jgi:hypothetical protein